MVEHKVESQKTKDIFKTFNLNKKIENMQQNEIDEIINHLGQKIENDVPGIVKILVRKKLHKLQSFEIDSLPISLRECTVEDLLLIVKDSLESGKLKI